MCGLIERGGLEAICMRTRPDPSRRQGRRASSPGGDISIHTSRARAGHAAGHGRGRDQEEVSPCDRWQIKLKQPPRPRPSAGNRRSNAVKERALYQKHVKEQGRVGGEAVSEAPSSRTDRACMHLSLWKSFVRRSHKRWGANLSGNP